MKEELERVGCKTYRFFDAVYGKANPYLRQSYIDRNIISPSGQISDGALGCLASHRAIWESALLSADSSEPFWILILEDDVRFHPLFNEALLQEYINEIPKEASIIKFGYLAIREISNNYKAISRHYVSFEKMVSYSTCCYAIKSDILRKMLNIKFHGPIDCCIWPNAYGVSYPESILGVSLDSYAEWRKYYNPNLKKHEIFHGFINVASYESSTLITHS